MYKRITALVLATTLTFSFCSCENEKDNEPVQSSSESSGEENEISGYESGEEAAKAVCDGIAEAVEGLDNVVYFVVINGSEIENIVLSRKVNHKYVCIFPHGCIDITEDEYENASDLSYEQAYDIYMELVKSE